MGESRRSRPRERLVQTPVLGPMLEKDDALRFDAVRLERARAAIHRRISARSASSERETTVRSYPRRRKMSRRRYAIAAGVTTVILSAGASAYLIYQRVIADEAVEEEPSPPVESPKKSAPRRRGRRPQPAIINEQDAAPSIDSGEEHRIESNMSVLKPRRSGSRTEETSVEPPLAPSALDAQLKIFTLAKQQAREGRHLAALKTLDELNRRYPRGSLELESMELRARSLYHMGRYGEAADVLETLTEAPVSAGKKAQFFRLLGDAQSREGRCKPALESYRRALGLGLEGDQADAARMGMKKCTLQRD
jgi:tetratricopeptide (TPR) repeat protein